MEGQFICYLKTKAHRLTVNVCTNEKSQIKSLALQRAADVMQEIGRSDITDFEWVAYEEK